VSTLKPSTLAILATVRGPVGVFADLGDRYVLGPFKVYPRTDGQFALCDMRKHWACRVVSVQPTPDDALAVAQAEVESGKLRAELQR
jgi:hypothetical protein